jgi:DNA-binding transcriptional LysR family regulator
LGRAGARLRHSSEAIKRVVAAGGGVGCLSRFAVSQSLDDGRLVEVRTRLPRAGRKLSIVLHREKRLGHVTSDFLQHCANPSDALR